MIFYDKKVLSIFTAYFLVVLTFTTGQEGNTTVQQSISNTRSGTQDQNRFLKNGSRAPADYEWDNYDDYDDGYTKDDQNVVADPPQSGDNQVNGADTAYVPRSGSFSPNLTQNESNNSSTILVDQGNITSPQNISEGEPLSSQEPSDGASDNDTLSTTPTTNTDITDNANTSESENFTSTPTLSPNPIITDDLGDVSNYTSTQVSVEPIATSGLRTWAVVVVSVLLSFAAIFTILYFIRKELIRRRKEDQRRLLRGSISSEGYFYGDGDGTANGKFEL